MVSFSEDRLFLRREFERVVGRILKGIFSQQKPLYGYFGAYMHKENVTRTGAHSAN